MRNNETGEFEMVVGNRQLLSGFFIGVLLLAVVFAMGYVVGQNSPRTSKVVAETPAAGIPTTVELRPQPASPSPPPPVTSAAQPGDTAADAGAAPADAQPQPTTQPARDVESQPGEARAPVLQSELPPGSFWQVYALKASEAEVMRQTLRDKGFPVVLNPAPNNLVRVLVGPYTDTASMGHAKAELEKAGFPTPIKK